MPDVYEFYNLGIGDPVPISAASRLGIGDMLEVVAGISRREAGRKKRMTDRGSLSWANPTWENLLL